MAAWLKNLPESVALTVIMNTRSISFEPLPALRKEIRDFIAQEHFQHLTLAKSMVRDRIAFRKAARDGLAVIEFGQDSKAVNVRKHKGL